MRRRVQTVGGVSFSVTLPKEWVERNGIKPKNPLDIREINKKFLLISCEKTEKKKKVVIRVDGLSGERLSREIISSYVSGCNEIILKSNKYFSVEKRKIIQKMSMLLVGFEIFENNQSTIELKKISGDYVPTEQYFKKMLKITMSMFDDFIKLLLGENGGLGEDLIFRDESVDRINHIIMRRCVNTIKHFTFSDPPYISIIDVYHYEREAVRIERIADHVVKMTETFLKLGKRSRKEVFAKVEKELKITKKYIDFLEKLVLTGDEEIGHKILDSFIKDKEKILRRNSVEKVVSSDAVIRDSLYRISSYVANIAEGTINLSKRNY